ncbi:ComEA family DNA-binding protein [Streptomyces roseofulvus]|uniref:ComEA family DNA-binding protein n=1 Tax=Streptomyces roseofulvus TaxID=33902 RepID=UPI0031F8AC8C
MDLRTASSPSSLTSSSGSSRSSTGLTGPRRGAPPGRARRRARVRRVLAPPGPGGDGTGAVRERGDALFPPRTPDPPVSDPPPVVDAVAVEEPGAVGVGERRWRSAVRERLPLWVQTRCGLEPRSLAALAVVLGVAACAAGGFFWAGRPEQVRAPEAVPVAPVVASPTSVSPSASAGDGGASAKVVVDVGGKVRRPGVLTLPAGSRVADALRAAGGVRAGTDLTGLNRARVLFDGEQVLVGVPGAAAGAGPGGGAAGAATGAAGVPLSLNTATAEEFDALPGVGPVLARRLVDHRTQHGGFRSVEELREVDGIGERRYADLQPLVRP